MVIKPNQGEADGLAYVRKDVLVERFSKLNRGVGADDEVVLF